MCDRAETLRASCGTEPDPPQTHLKQISFAPSLGYSSPNLELVMNPGLIRGPRLLSQAAEVLLAHRDSLRSASLPFPWRPVRTMGLLGEHHGIHAKSPDRPGKRHAQLTRASGSRIIAIANSVVAKNAPLVPAINKNRMFVSKTAMGRTADPRELHPP